MRKLRNRERYVLFLGELFDQLFPDSGQPWPCRWRRSRSIPHPSIVYIGVLLCSMLLCSTAAHAQQAHSYVLSGVVRSSVDGRGIEGVSIRHDKKLVHTNSMGAFTITVDKPTGLLWVRHIGYSEQKITYSPSAMVLDIEIVPTSKEIEEVEVISTGYQRIPRDRATGSFVHIDNTLLNQRVGSTVMERLDGIVPGLQFDNRDGTPILNIRGINTLSTLIAQPLIILDNFPYVGNLNSINPDDIESVTILKDAAAAAIWGSRAGNGVIVITSKKSTLNGKTVFRFNSAFRLTEKDNLFYIPAMTAKDFLDVEKFLFDNNHYDRIYNSGSTKFYVMSPYVDLLQDLRNGIGNLETINKKVEKWKTMDYRNDLLKYSYTQPFLQQYNFNMSSGSERIAFLTNLAYEKRKGNLFGSNSQRFNLSIRNTIKISNTMQANIRLQYINQRDDFLTPISYPINPGGQKLNLYPYAELIDDAGNNLEIPYGLNKRYIDGLANTALLDWTFVPFEEQSLTNDVRDNKTFIGELSVNKRWFPYLSTELTFQYDDGLNSSNINRTAASFFTRNLLNRYTNISNETVTLHIPYGDILTRNITAKRAYRGRLQTNFNKTIAEDVTIDAIGGFDVSHTDNSGDVSRIYGFDKDVWTKRVIDYSTSYPLYEGIGGNQQIPYIDAINGFVQRSVSIFANGALSYRNRYTLTVSGRRDAANLYGVKTNDKWKPLWSTGFLWNIINADNSWRAIDMLRLRTSFGHSGNMRQGGNTRSSIINVNNSLFTTLPYALITAPANPNLKWEDVRMYNLGIEYQLRNRILYGSLEWFDKKSTDLITDIPLDPTTGFQIATYNVGTMRGRGVDISIGTYLQFGAHRLDIKGNFSKVQDKIVDYYRNPTAARYLAIDGGKSFRPIVGKPTYPAYSFKFAGLDPQTGEPQGYLNGVISKDYTKLLNGTIDDLIYHGPGLPPWYGNLALNYTWQGFHLYLNFAFKGGHVFKKKSIEYYRLFEFWQTHSDYARRWQKPGDELTTNIPALIYPAVENRDIFYNSSSATILKGDLVRFQDLSIAKNFSLYKNMFTASFHMNQVGLLWTANKEKLDPDYNNLPPPRSYSLSISTTF